MGSWGSGVFENDDASDLLAELQNAEPEQRLTLVGHVLREAVDTDDYLQVDQGNTAIAAAALVAAAWPGGLVRAAGEYSPPIELPPMTAELLALAVQALERVAGANSEWSSLWGEGGALKAVHTLARRLDP